MNGEILESISHNPFLKSFGHGIMLVGCVLGPHVGRLCLGPQCLTVCFLRYLIGIFPKGI